MSDGGSSARGLPLLSGPPSLAHTSEAIDASCRKCNKDLQGLFTRARRCEHCGYMYCAGDADYTALKPREGGYDAAHVCSFCINYLTVTASGRAQLKALPLARLREYIDAYGLKRDGAVEKGDLVDVIVNAKGPNGCLPAANENHYRRFSVPSGQDGRPRGFFSSRAPPPAQLPRQSTTQRAPAPDFARPDLDRSDEPRARPRTSPPSPSQPQEYRPTPPPPPPHGGYPQYHRSPSASHRQPNRAHPAGPGSAQRSSSIPPRTAPAAPPPRPRTTSAAPSPQPQRPSPPPPPVPSLDELLAMDPNTLGSLSVHALKGALFANHVRAPQVLEKAELVERVRTMIEDERREREAARLRQEEDEEREREAARLREEEEEEREMAAAIAESAREAREREEVAASQRRAEADAGRQDEGVADAPTEPQASEARASPPAEERPKPKPMHPAAQARATHLERTGLCVICQDEEANIAIVDCGHMALCRACSDLVMSSTRECPLCRTRIVTESRLLRIFKA